MTGKVAFIYNSLPDKQRTGVFSECCSGKTVQSIRRALALTGCTVLPLNLWAPSQLSRFLVSQRPEFAFCIAEGFLADPETLYNGDGAASVRRALQAGGIPVSHSSAGVMELCRQKEQTYRVLAHNGVSCPWNLYLPGADQGWVGQDIPDSLYPLFVKPSGGGNSIGVDGGSIVNDLLQLSQRISQLSRTMGDTGIIIESDLGGMEYTVGVIGNAIPIALPPLSFPAGLVRSAAVKRQEGGGELPVLPVEPQDPIYDRLRDIAVQTFKALGAADALRIDIRADDQGRLFVIDVNGTPSLAPTASLAKMAALTGIHYEDFLALILNYGRVRMGLSSLEIRAQVLDCLVALSTEEMIA